MKKRGNHFTPAQVDQQIESFSRSPSSGQDAATDHEADARLFQHLRRVYHQQTVARRSALERVMARLLQYEAQSAESVLSPATLHSASERKTRMEHPISGFTPRHSLPQRLGLLAAAALLVLLVGSMAIVINLAHQHRESISKQGTAKVASSTTAADQSNIYIAFGTTIEKLDSKTAKALWTFSTPVAVYSPVTVVGNVVYIAPQDNAIFALNATNGKLLWQTQYKHFNGSIVVVQSTVYARDLDAGWLYALDALNGQVRWQRQLDIPAANLVVVGDSIYVTATIESPSTATFAALYALKSSNGAEIWHKTIANQSLINTPQIVNGVLYADSTIDNKGANPPDRHSYVYAFNAKTGVMLWRSSEIMAYVGNAPTVANNMVYVGSNALGTDGPTIYAFRASDGTLVWKKAVSNSVDSWMQVDNGVLYVAEGTLSSNAETPVVALDASNGSVRWSHQLTDYFEFEHGDATINNGLLYITTLDGLIHVLQTTDGMQIRSYSLGNARFVMMHPTLVLAP